MYLVRTFVPVTVDLMPAIHHCTPVQGDNTATTTGSNVLHQKIKHCSLTPGGAVSGGTYCLPCYRGHHFLENYRQKHRDQESDNSRHFFHWHLFNTVKSGRFTEVHGALLLYILHVTSSPDLSMPSFCCFKVTIDRPNVS